MESFFGQEVIAPLERLVAERLGSGLCGSRAGTSPDLREDAPAWERAYWERRRAALDPHEHEEETA
jgi:hypothetical protein